ncbi:MAG: GNAT family N-acetyltransferase [Rhodobacteraceae bacterium]|nr:GNAT family N-acetyltransferase [Paracoccaceae bacterium]
MSGWAIRPMTPQDVDATLAMRAQTRENAMSLAELEAEYGVTPETAAEALRTCQSGWLCERDGGVIGFCVGDRVTGEVVVLAILPDDEGRGLGKALLLRVHACLAAAGHRRAWLWANPDPEVRASGFYAHMGYLPQGTGPGGDLRLECDLARAP